jgi:protein-S-isoprenylcysteine O-methyltransferase Ste14
LAVLLKRQNSSFRNLLRRWPRFLGGDLEPMTYDALMRLPLLGWCALLAAGQLAGLCQFINAGTVDVVYVIHIAMRLSTIAFTLLIAAAAILRSRPSAKASGLEPRISALVGSFLIYGVMLFPRRDLSLSAEIISTLLILVGSIAAIVTLSQLGRSFSVMAETRRLVTRGPYRFVRHPLYIAEEIAILGVFMQFASVSTALLLAVQIAFQLRRMHHEEAVLTANFPEYDVYQQNTSRLIPGIY